MKATSKDPDDWLGNDAAATDAALDRALDLEGEERRLFLDELPPDRRRRVAELLAAVELGGPLDGNVGNVAGQLLESAERVVEPSQLGRRIGAWRLVERIGAGGMGVVYRAERVGEDFHQEAALKVIRWELADRALLERFRAERRILAQLNHPHIAGLLDGGMTADGLPYLVLELVDGRPVDEYCADAGLGRAERLRLMVKVCRAVDFAHRQLVVHRDLKPSNILVRDDGAPKLVDFGVAKLLDQAGEPTMLAPMTPRYAAPEQRRGETVSIAADVWALGRILEELVSGTGSKAASGDLTNILARAMHEEPERRYHTAAELADDVERHLGGQPVRATPPTLRYRLAKLVERHRAAAAALVLAAVLAVLGLAGVLWQAREARLERDAARREAVRAEQVTHFLIELFEGSAPRLGEEPRVRDLLDKGAERIRSELDDAPEARAKLQRALATAYASLLEFDRAEELARDALAIEERLDPGGERHAMTLAILGGVFMRRDEMEKAHAHYLDALAMLDAAGVGETESRASLLNSLGMTSNALGEAAESRGYLVQSAEIFRRLEHQQGLGMALGNLGVSLDRLGEHRRAEEKHRQALEIYRSTTPQNRTISTLLNNLSKCLASQGRLDEAFEAIREAAELERRAGESGSSLAMTEGNLAFLLILHGRGGEAIELSRRAAAAFERLHPESFSHAATRANLGWALVMEEHYDEGLEILASVVAELEERFGPEHRLTARSRARYGAALVRVGRGDEAAPLLDAAVEIFEQNAPDETYLADALITRGVLACESGDAAAGLADVERARAVYGEVLGDEHWHTARAEVERARCLEALGRPFDADSLRSARHRLATVRGESAWVTRRADDLQR